MCPAQLSTFLEEFQGACFKRKLIFPVTIMYVLVIGSFMDRQLIFLGQPIAFFVVVFDLSVNRL